MIQIHVLSEKKATNMSFDSRPSDFNDAAEALLMNFQAGSTTPSSHGENCNRGGGTGQGLPTYSCGCYNYNKLPRYQVQAEATDLLNKAAESNVADKLQNDLDSTSKLKLVCN